MEMSIFKKEGKTYTKFKITLKEFKSLRNILVKNGSDENRPGADNSSRLKV